MSYGLGSYGEFAYGDAVFPSLDPDTFGDFLAKITAPRCWLLEIDAFSLAAGSAKSGAYADAGAYGELGFAEGVPASSGGPQTLRYSSHGYISTISVGGIATSDPDSQDYYSGRIGSQIAIDRRIIKSGSFVGLTQVFAEVRLVNADGELDTLQRDYALDGRAVTLLLGGPADPRSSFGVVFRGVVQKLATSLTEVQLSLSDGSAKLDLPIQTTLYAGTGGLEGGADLAGKPKPLCYGQVYGISPPLVDAVNLIYQVHDGAIQDVPAVYDRGIALAKVAGAPAGGQYQVDAANGTFTLGAAPSGTVTCNAQGDTSLSGYINRTADIVLRILSTKAGLVSTEIDPSSFFALNTDAPAAIGKWIGTEPTSIAQVIDELLSDAGAFGGFSRLGAFTVGMVAAAAGMPDATYSSEDIISIAQEPLPADIDPAVWRVNVAYQKNYTVQTDLAAAVPDAQRDFASQSSRITSTENAAIRGRRLLARELNVTAGLRSNLADADDEKARVFGLWSPGRKLFRSTLPPKAMPRDLGDVVYLQHPRLGLDAGAAGRVLGHAIRGTAVELLVLV